MQKNIDEEKKAKRMMLYMQTDEALDNLYIFHLKILQRMDFCQFIQSFMTIWDTFGLLNYSTYTQQTLSAANFINDLEAERPMHDGDEILIVINEPLHDLKIYYKDNWIPHGYDGSARKQSNKQKQKFQHKKWLEHCESTPWKCIFSIKTDLLSECFKVFLLQNSKAAKITTPKQVEVHESDAKLDQIINKYGLK